MLDIIVISDSSGETANSYANSLMIQFPKVNFNKKIFYNIDQPEKINNIFEDVGSQVLVISTIVLEGVAKKLREIVDQKGYCLIDLMTEPMEAIEAMSGQESIKKVGLMRDHGNKYFEKIEAIEFAMKYDDGKDPRGFLQSDIVLLGVSRTSKTPLSIYMANKAYKVSNLPLIPELPLPDELFEVDRKRIIGLLIDEKKLEEIRQQRLKIMGLEQGSIYSNDGRIREELAYSQEVYRKLSCKVINVTGRTIEEIASEIVKYLGD